MDKKLFCFKLLLLIVIFVFLIFSYPGIYSSDALFYLSGIIKKVNPSVMYWESAFFVKFLIITYSENHLFFLSSFALMSVNIFLFFFSINIVSRFSKKGALISLFLILLIPSNIFTFFSLERDFVFSRLLIIPSVYFLTTSIKNRSYSFLGLGICALTQILIVYLRKEGFVCSVLFIFQCLYFLKNDRKKQLVTISSYSFVLMVSFYYNIFEIKSYLKNDSNYSFNLTVPYYHYLVDIKNRNVSHEELILRDKIFINDRFGYEQNRIYFQDIKKTISQNTLKSFNEFIFWESLKHPLTILFNRLKLFLSDHGNLLAFKEYKELVNRKKSLPTSGSYNVIEKRELFLKKILGNNTFEKYFLKKNRIYNNLIEISQNHYSKFFITVYIFLLLYLLCTKTYLDIVIMSHLPIAINFLIIFLFAPEINQRYLYTQILFVMLIAPSILVKKYEKYL